jgi:nicotinate-nucleotide pyrophosphorylase (carboxylating)
VVLVSVLSPEFDFQQVQWDARTIDDCRQIIRLAVREDLDRGLDLTTVALVPPQARGAASVAARQGGTIAGLLAIPLVIEEMNLQASWTPDVEDGAVVAAGACLGRIRGVTRDLLTGERILLNVLGRLCGIASWTQQFVASVAGTSARIYDTRKTTPGWRRLEKYAVRCGGGTNHRTGLYDAILIKDNHLAQSTSSGAPPLSPAAAVVRAREFLTGYLTSSMDQRVLIEVEVDTLEQFDEALRVTPDIILLDNMSTDQLRQCVQRRNAAGAKVELEASGGISRMNIRAVAETGVDRISLGALTHSAIALDVGLDWEAP